MTALPLPALGVAAIYCRISDDREGAGLGVARQEADCRPLCERRGYSGDAIRLYIDNDVSAYSGKRRPEYERLLTDIASGQVRLVVAWHGDRLHRSPIELEAFIATVEAAGVDVETARAGVLDLSTPSGRMVARQLGAVARYESEHKSERQRRKHQELAEAGKSSGGGTRPYGYQADRRTVEPAEAAYVREAAERVLKGESIRSICRDFTARGAATVQGGTWKPTVLRNVLLSARISGRREHGRRDPHTRSIVAGPITSESAECEAIISPEISDRLRELLGDTSRRRVQPWNRRSYLLHGIARCGLDGCGKPLIARPRGGGARCYVCATGPGVGGCGKIRITAEDLEAQVQLDVVSAIDGGAFDAVLREGDDTDAGAAREETIRLQERLDGLGKRYAAEEFGDSEWRAMRAVLVERLDAAERRYAELRGSRSLRSLPAPLLPAWEALDYGSRRSILADLVSEVRVGPGVRGLNRFDPRRVSIVWKV
jgi:DNA invertase Pin-like site-specific DNA recombinase